MADLGLPDGGLPTDLGSQSASSLLGNISKVLITQHGAVLTLKAKVQTQQSIE